MKADCGGCSSLPNEIHGNHWAMVFMNSLARQMRKMGPEFAEPKHKLSTRKRRPKD